VSKLLEPKTLIDIGSGLGIWSKIFTDTFPNIDLAIAIDLERHKGEILDELEGRRGFEFIEHNLESLQRLPGDNFDLAICVEVLEHVSPEAAQIVFDEFAAKCSFVIFGAAIKGQGGTHHINEQSFQFWTNEMLRRGLVPLDVVRPQLADRKDVPGYYKYNIILWWNPLLSNQKDYSFTELFSTYPPTIIDTRPMLTRLRYLLLSFLPHKTLTKLAQLAELFRKLG
jgi:hypothetical protein